MRLIQYIILSILVWNGMQPLLIDAGLLDANVVIEVVDCSSEQSDCPSEDSDNEGTTEDDLTQPSKPTLKEPKPNDINDHTEVVAIAEATQGDATPPYATDPILTETNTQAKISSGLLERCYFSKSDIAQAPVIV